MLRRIDDASIHQAPPHFLDGSRRWVYFRIGRRTGTIARWTGAEFNQWIRATMSSPARLGRYDGRHYWAYAGRIYSESEGLSREEVQALLISRDRRARRKIDRAVAMVHRAEAAPTRRREHIPDDVKQFVWERDQGRCTNCGAATDLEFDHIIPVSMGGSSTERNLQLLCASCNGMKAAGLTTRGIPE